MSAVAFPVGFLLETLRKEHPRKDFVSSNAEVDAWLTSKALQHQEKHLSVTRVLIEPGGLIAGFYTLATGQIDFSDLPSEISKRLPHRTLPIATLAWLGVHQDFQKNELGTRLLAQALADCYFAGQTFAFVAVIVDAIDESSKQFYQRYNFRDLPGHGLRMFLSTQELTAMMESDVEPS